MTITREYAEYAAELAYRDLPDDVVAYAKHLILDTVGLAVGSGPQVASTDALVGAVADLDAGGEGATVLTTGDEASPAYAALLNAAMVHSLDFDDTHRGGSLHPGAAVIGTALTAALYQPVRILRRCLQLEDRAGTARYRHCGLERLRLTERLPHRSGREETIETHRAQT